MNTEATFVLRASDPDDGAAHGAERTEWEPGASPSRGGPRTASCILGVGWPGSGAVFMQNYNPGPIDPDCPSPGNLRPGNWAKVGPDWMAPAHWGSRSLGRGTSTLGLKWFLERIFEILDYGQWQSDTQGNLIPGVRKQPKQHNTSRSIKTLDIETIGL